MILAYPSLDIPAAVLPSPQATPWHLSTCGIPCRLTREYSDIDYEVFRRDNHKIVFTSIRRGDLYIVDFTKRAQPKTCLIAKSSKGWLWHRRLGHVGMRNLDKLIKGDHILGVKDVIFDDDRL